MHFCWLLYHFILLWVVAPCFPSAQAFFACTIPFWLEREPCVVVGKLSAVRRRVFRHPCGFYSKHLETARTPAAYYYLLKERVSSEDFLLFAFFLNPVSSLLMTVYGSLYRLYLLLRAECVASSSLNSLFQFILTSVFIYFLLLLRVNL